MSSTEDKDGKRLCCVSVYGGQGSMCTRDALHVEGTVESEFPGSLDRTRIDVCGEVKHVAWRGFDRGL